MRVGRRIACKRICLKKINKDSKIWKQMIRELDIMCQVLHPNIMRFIDVQKTPNNLYLFIEFCNGGDLERFYNANYKQLDEKLTKVIIKQIIKGLHNCNKLGFIHRDLKLPNIMCNFPD